MDLRERKHERAFSLVEIIVLATVVFVVLLVLLPPQRHYPAKASRIRCVNNLKNVGLAFRVFETDQKDLFPAGYLLSLSNSLPEMQCFQYFQWLSNEISSPRILLCPADTKRKEATSFATMSNIN